MVDKTNPTNQFHPYSPAEATPHSEEPAESGLRGMLARAGIDTNNLGAIGEKLKGFDARQSMSSVRNFARSNPALALGGLAALAIGAGLMRRRA